MAAAAGHSTRRLARSCDAGEGGQTETMIPKRCSKGACEREKNKKNVKNLSLRLVKLLCKQAAQLHSGASGL